jgi:2-dehydro-3-deoxy-D-arabinonate dehydratase
MYLKISSGTDTVIDLSIVRGGEEVFNGQVTLAQMKRKPEELLHFLYREMAFPRVATL